MPKTLTQYLEDLTVTTNGGATVPLRYSFRQGVFHAKNLPPIGHAPEDQPFVTIRKRGGRRLFMSHSRNYVFDYTLFLQVHQKPLAAEIAPDPKNALLLWRELLKMDSPANGVDTAQDGGVLVPPLLLAFAPTPPQELPGSRELLGEVQWSERIQMLQLD